MPSFNIVKKSNLNKTFRTQSVIGQFDLQIDKDVKEQFIGNIAIENEDWKVGIIVGSSGSGKSTIAKQLFEEYYINNYEYDNNAVIDNMPDDLTVQQITGMFNSVGFATVWSWLKPYSVLSNGEKMRVDLARAILSNNEIIVFDEFTSVVDRTVAKTASYAISRAIKKTNKKFIAVACHRDIVDWLEPDWIYDTDEQRFFFAKPDINDQKCKLKLENVAPKYGSYLENIII
jgi:ABC-type multidrug transport system fused ATPase/permease subunit